MAATICLGTTLAGTTGCSSRLDKFNTEPRGRFFEKYTSEGNSWLAKRKYEQAAASFKIALSEARHLGQSDMRLGFALENLGHSLLVSGQIEEAANYFSEALKVYGECEKSEESRVRQELLKDAIAQCYSGLGQIHIQKREYEKAREDFSKALEEYGNSALKNPLLSQNLAAIFDGLGCACMYLGDYEKAEAFFSRGLIATANGIGTDRLKAEIILDYAKCLKLSGQPHRARELYKEIPKSGSGAEWQELRSKAFEALTHQDFKQAENIYSEALRKAQMVNPQSDQVAEIYKDLARVYIAQKRMSDAISAINTALNIKQLGPGPADTDTERLLAQAISAFLIMGEYQKALPLIEKHYQLSLRLAGENSASALENRAWFAYVLHKRGQEAQCTRVIEDIMPRMPYKQHKMRFANAQITLAEIFEDRKDYASA